jgi:hypothetical protein
LCEHQSLDGGIRLKRKKEKKRKKRKKERKINKEQLNNFFLKQIIT